MSRSVIRSISLAMAVACASASLPGCTAVGFGIGAVRDAVTGKGPASRLVGVREGTRVTIWMRDGRRLHGRFEGYSAPDSLLTMAAHATDATVTPSKSMLLLRTGPGVEKLDVNDVTRVSVPVATGKIAGSIIGLAADAAMIAALYAALSSMN